MAYDSPDEYRECPPTPNLRTIILPIRTRHELSFPEQRERHFSGSNNDDDDELEEGEIREEKGVHPHLQDSDDMLEEEIPASIPPSHAWDNLPPCPSSESTEGALRIFTDTMEKQHIIFSLVRVMTCLRLRNLYEAERKAQNALDLSWQTNHKPLVARCHFWMGRVEFARENFDMAYRYFLAAKACFDFCPEGDDIPRWITLSRPGLTKKQRDWLILKQLCERFGRGPVEDLTEEVKAKRDWKEHGSKGPGASSECQKTTESTGLDDDKGTRRERRYIDAVESIVRVAPPTRLTIWLRPDSKDLKPKCSRTTNKLRCRSRFGIKKANADMAWLAASTNSNCRPPQCEFTFRVYPKGLATRTRSTNIFSEQRNEVIIPVAEWVALKEGASHKFVTMHFLSREMEIVHRRILNNASGEVEMSGC